MSDFGIILEKGLIGIVLGGLVAIIYYIFKKLTIRQPRDPSYNSIRQKRTSQPSVKEKPISQPIVQETKTKQFQPFQPFIDQKTTKQKNMANSETEGRGLRVIKGDIGGRGVKTIEFEAEDGSQTIVQTPWLTYKEMLAYTGLPMEEFENLLKEHPLPHGGGQRTPLYNVDVIDKWLSIKKN